MPRTEVGLLKERRADALWLTLDRPEKRNALTLALATSLADALGEAASHETARVVVITGRGRSFCAGGDLDDLSKVAARGATEVAQEIYGNFHRIVTTIASSPLPVIAAVNGPAVGAGLDLAMACDLRYASSSAFFASSWINVGLVPGMGGAHLLTRAIGAARASELVLRGQRITAEQAVEWGLVASVHDPTELKNHVQEVVDGLVALSPLALARTKASLRRALSQEFASELAVLGATQGALMDSESFREVARRFSTGPGKEKC